MKIDADTHAFIKIGMILQEYNISYEFDGDGYDISDHARITTLSEAEAFLGGFRLAITKRA